MFFCSKLHHQLELKNNERELAVVTHNKNHQEDKRAFLLNVFSEKLHLDEDPSIKKTIESFWEERNQEFLEYFLEKWKTLSSSSDHFKVFNFFKYLLDSESQALKKWLKKIRVILKMD